MVQGLNEVKVETGQPGFLEMLEPSSELQSKLGLDQLNSIDMYMYVW